MTSADATLAVIDALEQLQIPYMLVGSISTSAYGISRSSKDADIVLELGGRPIKALADQLGSAFRLDPQMSFETVTMTTRHIIEVDEVPFTIELFHLSDDEHDQERFRRRLRVKLFDRETWLPQVEDVIVTKARWSHQGRRTKDSDDVRDVISVQGDALDWNYIYGWADRHGTRALLDEIRKSIPLI
jgi:hypothetical protein